MFRGGHLRGALPPHLSARLHALLGRRTRSAPAAKAKATATSAPLLRFAPLAADAAPPERVPREAFGVLVPWANTTLHAKNPAESVHVRELSGPSAEVGFGVFQSTTERYGVKGSKGYALDSFLFYKSSGLSTAEALAVYAGVLGVPANALLCETHTTAEAMATAVVRVVPPAVVTNWDLREANRMYLTYLGHGRSSETFAEYAKRGQKVNRKTGKRGKSISTLFRPDDYRNVRTMTRVVFGNTSGGADAKWGEKVRVRCAGVMASPTLSVTELKKLITRTVSQPVVNHYNEVDCGVQGNGHAKLVGGKLFAPSSDEPTQDTVRLTRIVWNIVASVRVSTYGDRVAIGDLVLPGSGVRKGAKDDWQVNESRSAVAAADSRPLATDPHPDGLVLITTEEQAAQYSACDVVMPVVEAAAEGVPQAASESTDPCALSLFPQHAAGFTAYTTVAEKAVGLPEGSVGARSVVGYRHVFARPFDVAVSVTTDKTRDLEDHVRLTAVEFSKKVRMIDSKGSSKAAALRDGYVVHITLTLKKGLGSYQLFVRSLFGQ
eukprot:Rhum_TRINITY_DN12384_c0_g1::Rhum_TRINITY_DN12384_c0_g1_i1::g.51386::m.51386